MTGFQIAQPQTAPSPATWSEPKAGRHASVVRARLTLRRLFYVARHLAG